LDPQAAKTDSDSSPIRMTKLFFIKNLLRYESSHSEDYKDSFLRRIHPESILKVFI
jgi:hypothetical protein